MKITKIECLFPNCCRNPITNPELSIYSLQNDHNVRVGLMNFGASAIFVETPDKQGNTKNIALSLGNFESYAGGGTYAGETLGPVAGRIRKGVLPIEGREYLMPRNDFGNSLHSGPKNLSHTYWTVVRTFYDDSEVGIIFEQERQDGDGGLPGNRSFSVRYALSNENTLRISYLATTSKTTWVNLSSHLYWNLSGDFTASGDSQLLTINSNRVLYNDEMHLPVSFENVEGTPFDFRRSCSIASAVERDVKHEQLLNARGYNNAYLLEKGVGHAAELADPTSGRSLTVETDYPSLVFYSGGYLGDAGYTLDHQKIAAGSAYALEAQYLPDSPHLQGRDTPFLRPGETYHKFISFHFGVCN